MNGHLNASNLHKLGKFLFRVKIRWEEKVKALTEMEL